MTAKRVEQSRLPQVFLLQVDIGRKCYTYMPSCHAMPSCVFLTPHAVDCQLGI